jgi:hypothetical protein
MTDRTEIIELVDAIFDTVDAKNWDATQALFESTVTVDFTSLNGGEPATVSGADLVDGWRQGLHAGKKSFHFVGHYRITGDDDDTATVAVKGYAYNVLDAEFGGGMWEVWGAYEFPVRRTPSGWRAAGISFFAWHTRGDDAVRTHLR